MIASPLATTNTTCSELEDFIVAKKKHPLAKELIVVLMQTVPPSFWTNKLLARIVTLHQGDFVVQLRDKKVNQNILHKCAISGNVKFVQLIALLVPTCKYQSLLNEQDAYHSTPLHYAVQTENSSMVETLLLMQCDATIKDANQHTALELALQLFQSHHHYSPLYTICTLLFDYKKSQSIYSSLQQRCQETVEQRITMAKYFKHLLHSQQIEDKLYSK